MDTVRRVAITTIDNPYSPFDEWESWNRYDTTHGYHSASFLARLTNESENLGETLYDSAIERAIDEMVEHNLLGLWIKAVRVGKKETRTSRSHQELLESGEIR